jgi:hypothetical protein
MPVLVVGSEKNITALHPRLFAGRTSRSDIAVAAEAIRAANPHADLDRLTPGTVLSIPEDVGARTEGDLLLDQTVDEGLDALAANGRELLDHLIDQARARERESGAEHRSVAKTLRSKELTAAMRKQPGLRKDVEAARKAVDDEEAATKERASQLAGMRDEWLAELASLQELIKQ